MRSWRFPAAASWMNDSTAGAAAWSSSQAIIAHASTTLDAGIVAGDFGGAVIGQVFEEVCTPEHAAHGVPVGIVPDKPLHDQRFAFHIDRHFRARLQVKLLPPCLGNCDLPFR